jgi:hypothetical protein
MVLLRAEIIVQQNCLVRYRMHLESRKLAPGTVNMRLGAVGRLAYEATDCILTSDILPAKRCFLATRSTSRFERYTR